MSSYARYVTGEHELQDLVGHTVTAIHWSEERLVFETAVGTVHGYDVEGDCCSWSYFHDFFGVEHLLNNGPVTEVGDVELADDDPRFKVPASSDDYDDCVQVYGYKIITVHPVFGEVTSVLSFRNSSNGYYGGSMERVEVEVSIPADAVVLTEDFIGE